MTGRAEVSRLEQKLDATFKRAVGVQSDPELLSDFARYLCVLVSGFIEQAVIEVVLEYVRGRSHPSVQQYVERRLRQFTNANTQRIIELLGSFQPDWRMSLEGFLVDERKDAIDSVVNLRNTIAHGGSVGVTMARVQDYYGRVKVVVEYIADLCVP